ncbi:hypothetical protein AB0L85_31920 [Streptomyces sp. NPDC052051]|uniref:hypothetical protein n=1 Tax=Streptomyces sp. NPDC052051 TaxID=3154649 RepID=UPI00342DBA75
MDAPGPWKTSGHLEAEGADTYSLDVDERDELCLWAGLNPSGPIAVFREAHAIEEIKAVSEGIAEAIRQHHATPDQG